MTLGEDDFGVGAEEVADSTKELVEAMYLEELLYARHRRANEGLDASDSDASMEPITDPSEIKLTSAREIESQDHKTSVPVSLLPIISLKLLLFFFLVLGRTPRPRPMMGRYS